MATSAVVACAMCSSSSSSVLGVVVAGSTRFQARRGVVVGAVGFGSSISSSSSSCVVQRPGCHFSSSSLFGRLSLSCSICSSSSGMVGAPGRSVVCEVAVKIGEEQGTRQVQPGSKIRVKVPVTVYHVSKLPNLNLEGLEGEVKEIIGIYKGKTVSANLPIKVQFFSEADGSTVKFFAHLKDDEFDVIG